ncbi:MAG TPA: UDP-N-acetylmuramoyl-L-alanyl-D-glutamate--2,6-diaminopimelate ligase [Blastocatellia bacterium]|nr:UDP-N-acetylmuramoyl-L-alanyl-D-glutamate--2,6-diaminopimelate ligase [Blastocatellia bacterium]
MAKEIGGTATGHLDREVLDVTHSSRSARADSAFVAIRGEKVDGNNYVRQAVEQGAVGVISELSADAIGVEAPAWIRVTDARAALALAAAAVHSHPSRQLKLVGITGTNGKTTTAHLVDSIIRTAEGTSALFGTISYRIGDSAVDASNTTPEASDIQRMLRQAVDSGCRSAVMEVSSHAIELHRADALQFAAAVFTNLTRDHLDYHHSMESYFGAKRKLFDGTLGSEPEVSVINCDDDYGRTLARTARGRLISYGLREDAEVRTSEFKITARGLLFVASTPLGQIEISSPLVGRPHVYNILAAIGAGIALGFNLETIGKGIRNCARVAGRFEQVTVEGPVQPGFSVVVDYAHTDDALRNVLQTAREVVGNSGRVVVVFGCGGDRDRTKRAPMGEIAGTLSDFAIVTSDNPRTEDPEAIISEIELGLARAGKPYLKLSDRREAIYRAIAEAREGDLVLIAGKGHETYQILGRKRIDFDDRQVAREAMRHRVGSD